MFYRLYLIIAGILLMRGIGECQIIELTKLGIDSVANSFINRIEKIDSNNLDNATLYDIQIDEAEVFINEIIYKLKNEQRYKLGKLIDEPLSIKLAQLSREVNIKREVINRILSGLDEEYYKEAIKANSSGDVNKTEKILLKSKEINRFNIKVLLLLSEIYYYSEELNKASENLMDLITKTYPDRKTYQQIRKISENLLNIYYKKIDSYIEGGEFSKADSMTVFAAIFCESTGEQRCKIELRERLIKSREGVYNSYISIAKSALRYKKPELAINFLKSAYEYYTENRAILSNKETLIKHYIDTMLVEYFAKANKLIEKNKIEQGYIYFEKASLLCDIIPDTLCNKKIEKELIKAKNKYYNQLLKQAENYLIKKEGKKAESYLSRAQLYRKENGGEITDTMLAGQIIRTIKYNEYLNLVESGQREFKQKQKEKARRQLEAAIELEMRYNLPEEKNLYSTMKQLSKGEIRDMFSQIEMYLWANEIEKAKGIFMQAEGLLKRYQIEEADTLKQNLEKYRNKITDKECEKDQQDYDVLLYKARRSIESKDYISADKYYEEAVNIVYRHLKCKLYFVEAYQSREKIAVQVNYQKLVAEAEYYNRKAEIKRYISYYAAADEYYELFKERLNDIRHIYLTEILKEKGEKELIKKGIDYYTEKGSYEKSFDLLEYLEKNKCRAEDVKNQQKELGRKLAERDFAVSKAKKYKVYVSKTKWYKSFVNGYKKQWRNRL